jgi:hypothetical protein
MVKFSMALMGVSLTQVSVAGNYHLVQDYLSSPSNFFSGFNFYIGEDPTNGTVDYLSESAAAESKLIGYNHESILLAADAETRLPFSSSVGRKSIRIEGKQNYTHGLFIADIAHVPSGCGLWPAFWLLGAGDDWPSTGEIDIMEGVHNSIVNQMTLHTTAGCSISNTTLHQDYAGTLQTADCNVHDPNQDPNAGCGITAPPHAPTFGDAFNQAGGGIYATEWTSTGINIWFFDRDSIPQDLRSNASAPSPANWQQMPHAQFSGAGCDWDAHFKEMRIIVNTAFCGAWAGADAVWEGSGCRAQTQMDRCEDYVKMHPGNFTEAYWIFNGLKVYAMD